MNNELKDRVYNIPETILTFLSQQKDVEGLTRNQHLLNDKQVTYGQLKRILHDIKNIDKNADLVKYNLYGGDLMWNWGMETLTNERNLVKNIKQSKKIADDISGMTGERKNSTNKTHRKKDSFLPPTNLIKANSEKFSFSTLIPSPLSEQIKRIKDLMI